MSTATPGRSVALLAVLAATAPVDLAVTGVALARAALRPAPRADPTGTTVLLSGGKMTKALALARAFHAAGHRVVLVESATYRLTGHRFSRSVDAFHVVPEPTDPAYAAALRDVVRAEGVDVYVPVCSPAASVPDADAAAALAELGCTVLHVGPDQVRMLDDKHAFAVSAAALGLGVPDTHRVTDPAQVLDFEFPPGRTYILKSLAYDPVARLDLTRLPLASDAATEAFLAGKPISADRPWILQEFVAGREYCTHSTVRDGRIQVWACCESSAFQVNYAMADRPDIRAWVERYVAAHRLTGQVSFDFIATDDRLVAIECNPRTHSAITMFHDHPALAEAYLGHVDDAITPLPGSRPTYWTYHELWRLLRRPGDWRERLRVLRAGTDAILDGRDPLPYLLEHHLQIPWLLVRSLRDGRGWSRVDFNIGKLVEAGGD